MRSSPRTPWLLAIAVLLVQGCTTVPTTQAPAAMLYEARYEALSSLPGWSLSGRLAVRDEKDGGSGTLQWQHAIESSRMDFYGAFGRGAWRLQADGSGAELELADGSLYGAPSVTELVRTQLGWTVPVDALSWWILGLAAPGEIEARVLSDDGTLEKLRQSGWTIEFGRYRDVDGVSLPLRLTAIREERSVKLAVRDWALDSLDD